MADRNSNSPKISVEVSHCENPGPAIEQLGSIPGPLEYRISEEHSNESVSCKNPSPQNEKSCIDQQQGNHGNQNRNGVGDGSASKSCSFLKPSSLSGGSSFGGTSSDASTTETPSKCPLKSPRLNLTPSKFGNLDGSSLSASPKLPFQQSKSPFTNSVFFENGKNDSQTTKTNTEQTDVNNSSGMTGEKLSKPSFSNLISTKPLGSSNSTNSTILVPNFVFGQNLHERVAEGVTTTTSSTEKKISEASNGNSASDMLFTSVLTSKEIVKENIGNNTTSGAKEPFSLIEDAARCQEARANKRKYEEVLVTTGEEDEENILQVNVKLFAFDSGTWVERGRGILRLNDKNCDGTTISRIVIRALGSLRVVLNTNIWNGMSLSRASERSIRLTAMDPNGLVKIFLIQASPKDMGTLFRYLDTRLKRCQDLQGGPEKKRTEEFEEEATESPETKT